MAVTLADKKAEIISTINNLKLIKQLKGDLDTAIERYEKELQDINDNEK